MKNKNNYKELINKNADKFNDESQLIDFIDSYINEDKSNITNLSDNIAEFIDGILPIYFYDIITEWQEKSDCHGLTLEQIGEYDGKSDIYKMMTSDLYFYYDQQLGNDYQAFIDLLEDKNNNN